MTSDRQRATIETALREHFPEPFEVSTYRDEVTVALPIWTEPGRVTAGRYRYASATTVRDLDGRRRVDDFTIADLAADLARGIRRGATDPRYTEQARADYARAAALLTI